MSMLSGLASLGRLTSSSKYKASKDARKTAAAFIHGKKRDGACQVPRSKGCNYRSTGSALEVKGATIAKRIGGNNTDLIEVCVNPADAEQRKAGNAIFSLVKAGVSVRGSSISGRKGRHRAVWPGCVKVQLTKKVREAAAIELNNSSLLTLKAGEKKAARKAGRKARKGLMKKKGK